jgi:hypothetical protein
VTGDRAHELTRAEESQAIALIPAMFEELRAQRATIEAMASRLPSQWLSLRDAAERMGVDPRTVVSMGERGDIVTRRAGRRVLVDASSLRPVDRTTVQALADAARAGR